MSQALPSQLWKQGPLTIKDTFYGPEEKGSTVTLTVPTHTQRSFFFPELNQFLMRGRNPKDEYATIAEPLLQGEVG